MPLLQVSLSEDLVQRKKINQVFNQRGKKNSSLSRINYANNGYPIDSLRDRIEKLDLQISEVTREIFNAQLVRARSMFSSESNFIQGFQKKFVESSAINSLHWHKRRLREISSERNRLQDQLDRYSGRYWTKRIRKLLLFICLWTLILLMASVVVLGFVAALYLLPFAALLVMSYLLIKKLNF